MKLPDRRTPEQRRREHRADEHFKHLLRVDSCHEALAYGPVGFPRGPWKPTGRKHTPADPKFDGIFRKMLAHARWERPKFHTALVAHYPLKRCSKRWRIIARLQEKAP